MADTDRPQGSGPKNPSRKGSVEQLGVDQNDLDRADSGLVDPDGTDSDHADSVPADDTKAAEHVTDNRAPGLTENAGDAAESAAFHGDAVYSEGQFGRG